MENGPVNSLHAEKEILAVINLGWRDSKFLWQIKETLGIIIMHVLLL